MTSEQYRSEIKVIGNRYHHLGLTFEQAERIYEYEKIKDTNSDNHFFSAWEEQDFELTAFRQILVGQQLIDYEKSLEKRIRRYEQDLIDQDRHAIVAKEIGYLQEIHNFYEHQFLPPFFEPTSGLHYHWLPSETAKLHYFKAEYLRFLNDTRTELLIIHFRHNRSFKPNELKATLLRHKLTSMLPVYDAFKRSMDEATKAIDKHLTERLGVLSDEGEALFNQKFNELKEFQKASFEKYYCDFEGGSIWTIETSREDEIKSLRMSMLLLDKDCYGYKTSIFS